MGGGTHTHNLQHSEEGEDEGGRLQQANRREVREEAEGCVRTGWGTQGIQSREFAGNEERVEQIF